MQLVLHIPKAHLWFCTFLLEDILHLLMAEIIARVYKKSSLKGLTMFGRIVHFIPTSLTIERETSLIWAGKQARSPAA